MKYSIKICTSWLFFSFFLVACSSKPIKVANEVSYGRDRIRKEANLSVYKTSGLCNGLLRVQDVKLAPGFCLGVVDTGEGLIKPRFALQLDATHLLLVDMGGWAANKGQLHLLTFSNNRWNRTPLLNSTQLPENKKCILDRPHQLVRGPEGEIYITSVQCIATLRPLDKNIVDSIQVKISGLPTEGLHPLKSIVFDGGGNIYMNVGSISDNCELETSDVCKELESRAQIRKYIRLADGSYEPRYNLFAKGQRNSMGLYWDEVNQNLWTAENSRDYIERKIRNSTDKKNPQTNLILFLKMPNWIGLTATMQV
ncbi:MAG: hypothetical protein ABL930_01140 [Pseudobdellovibrio sp.]